VRKGREGSVGFLTVEGKKGRICKSFRLGKKREEKREDTFLHSSGEREKKGGGRIFSLSLERGNKGV